MRSAARSVALAVRPRCMAHWASSIVAPKAATVAKRLQRSFVVSGRRRSLARAV